MRTNALLMHKYFSKSFFRFLGGFIAIILAALLIIVIAGYVRSQQDDTAPSQEHTPIFNEQG